MRHTSSQPPFVAHFVHSLIPSGAHGPGSTSTQCESKKFTPPLRFSEIFPKRLRIFNKNFTSLLLIHTYAKLQNFIQFIYLITSRWSPVVHAYQVWLP